jgi:hypothetical protein
LPLYRGFYLYKPVSSLIFIFLEGKDSKKQNVKII